MSHELKVQPVVRYSKPKYPGRLDPNPLDDPQALPYPFSQRILDWAFAVGLLSIGACHSDPKTIVLQNTFTFDKTGLPYHSPFFGTGLPFPLEAKKMREVALKVCQEECLNVQENVLWDKGGYFDIGFPINFYDEQSRIGISILDYQNLTNSALPDVFFRWDGYGSIFSTFDNWESAWDAFSTGTFTRMRDWLDIRNRANWAPDEHRLYDLFIQAALSDLSESHKWFFYKMYLRFEYDRPGKPVLFNKKAIEKVIHDKIVGDLKQELNQYDAHVFLLKIRPEKEWDDAVLQKYISTLSSHSYEAGRGIALIVGMKEGLIPCTVHERQTLEKVIDSLFRTYDPNWQTVVAQLAANYSLNRFDLHEVKSLDNLAEKKEGFIAPVSSFDVRFHYEYNDEEVERAIKEASEQLSNEDLAKLKEKSEASAMKRLEENLRMYIRWAKYQGQY